MSFELLIFDLPNQICKPFDKEAIMHNHNHRPLEMIQRFFKT
jgi:hypothetical protein